MSANKIALNITKKLKRYFFDIVTKKLIMMLNLNLMVSDWFFFNNVRYLGVYIDQHIHWNCHTSFLSSKLRKANGALSKLRHFVPKSLFKTVYYALFSGCFLLIWIMVPSYRVLLQIVIEFTNSRKLLFASLRSLIFSLLLNDFFVILEFYLSLILSNT